MNRAYLAVFGTLALAATGCVGEFETTGPPTTIDPPAADAGAPIEEENPLDTEADAAKALFESNVRGVVSATCGGSGCHSSVNPMFVPADPLSAYDVIQQNAPILFPKYISAGAKILENGTGAHKGAAFTPDDVVAIEGWLAQEKLDADADGGTTTVSALAEWSGCMSLADWEAEGVATQWSNKNAGNQGRCESCHNLGADGFVASDDYVRVFTMVSSMPAFMPSYFTLDATGTNVLINRARLESVGGQLAPHENHGAFEVDGNAMEALQRFYDLTLERKLAGQCGPPLF